MTKLIISRQITLLLKKGNPGEAIELFYSHVSGNSKKDKLFRNYLTVLSSRLTQVEKNIVLGLIGYEKSELIKNQIVNGLIKLKDSYFFDTPNTLKPKILSLGDEEQIVSFFKNFLPNGLKISVSLDSSEASSDITLVFSLNGYEKAINFIESNNATFFNKPQYLEKKNLLLVFNKIFTKADIEILTATENKVSDKIQAQKMGIALVTYRYLKRHLIKKIDNVLLEDKKSIRSLENAVNYLREIGY